METNHDLQTGPAFDFRVSGLNLNPEGFRRRSGVVRDHLYLEARRCGHRQPDTADRQGCQCSETGGKCQKLAAHRRHAFPAPLSTLFQCLADERLLEIVQAVFGQLRLLFHGRQQTGIERGVFLFNTRGDSV